MKRLVPLLISFLLLCGCIAPKSMDAPPVPEPEPTPSVEVVFYVDAQLDERFYEAAGQFSSRLEYLSNGLIRVQVLRGTDLSAALEAGTVQFAFLDSTLHRDLCSSFDAVSAPFLYSSYQNFTMVANSERALNLLHDDMGPNLGMKPIGAFLQEPVHLVTEWSTGDPANFTDAVIAIRSNEEIVARMLQMLEAEPVEAADVEARALRLISGEFHGAEFTLSELSGLYRSDSELYLTLTWHELDPVWLAVDEQLLQSSDPAVGAAIYEARSYLYQITDHAVLEEQQRILDSLELQGVIVLDDFSAERHRIYRQIQQLSPELVSDAQQYMLDITQQLRQ